MLHYFKTLNVCVCLSSIFVMVKSQNFVEHQLHKLGMNAMCAECCTLSDDNMALVIVATNLKINNEFKI